MKLTKTFSRVRYAYFGGNIVISPVGKEDIPEAIQLTETAFGHLADDIPDMADYLLNEVGVDWDLSLKAEIGGKIVGVYLLKSRSIHDLKNEYGDEEVKFKEDLADYADKVGLEGISLVVLPEYRGSGVGKQLKQSALSLGHDYMWGQQLHILNNLEEWKKTRRHVGDAPDVYVTLQDIEKKTGSPGIE